MWQLVRRNKAAAGMVALLLAGAVAAAVLAAGARAPRAPRARPPETPDISTHAHVFSTHSLPGDDHFMPSIGNGHVATNIFSDTVYMNGLYSGRRGNSRRARIPAHNNVRLNSTLHETRYRPLYSLQTRDGVFTVRVDRERSIVTQRIYAHKYYTRAIVTQIQVEPKTHVDPNFIHHEIWIAVTLQPGADSADIAFQEPEPEIMLGRTVWSVCGQTREPEDPVYQPLPVDVCVYWTSVPDHLVVPQHGIRVFTFAMTADNNKTVARNELFSVLQEDGEELYKKHVDEWHKLYQQAAMEIEGNLELSKIVSGIWYYLLSSLPAAHAHQLPARYYGLSPTGLARGGTYEDYEGHNFWDTEMWIFPSVLMLYPEYGRQLLQYRLDNAYVAAQLAKITGNKGIRFPWESAFTGSEVTQPCCPGVAEFEQHVTGCVAFAARQYLAATRDERWLMNGGCSLVAQIADFWASRAVINYTTGLYDIENVMGPDEDHSNVTNSVFTNVVAGYSLYLAEYVSCLCASYFRPRGGARWADVAWSLALPYDAARDYHPQFRGYTRGERIKQADAVLLGYPLQYPMNDSTLANDLSYYAGVTRGDGPAMTWSMHAAGHLRRGDAPAARDLFTRAHHGYVREPFKIWSELRRPRTGAVNFLTGMGGFLQTLVFGYAGISLHLDKLVINNPTLPPGTTRMKIRGVKYLGANMTVDIRERATLRVHAVPGARALVMTDGRVNLTLIAGMTVTLSSGPYIIFADQWKDCPLPADTIGHTDLRPITHY